MCTTELRGNGEQTMREFTRSWINACHAILDTLKLEEGWDGCGSPSPTMAVIRTALAVSLGLDKEFEVPAPHEITFTAAGHIVLEWLYSDGSAERIYVEGDDVGRLEKYTPSQGAWPTHQMNAAELVAARRAG